MKKTYWTGPPELGNPDDVVELWVEPGDLSPIEQRKRRKKNEAASREKYLMIGFDTEFKTPDEPLTPEEIRMGFARSLILSYQFYAKTFDGVVWQGICCPEGDSRISLVDFMVFVIGMGARQHGVKSIPSKVYLVGHFTRADIPAFSDFNEINNLFSAVRNTFVSIDNSMDVNIPISDGTNALVKIYIRDTILLTPQSSKRLKQLGDLVGVEKVELSEDAATYRQIIRNMDKLRSEDWDLFKRYALTDAEICVKYIEKVMDEYNSVTGQFKVPITLTGIGIDLLEGKWKSAGIDRLAALGKEVVDDSYFDRRKNYFIKKKKEVNLPEVSHHVQFATDCYHGGRNEQFWFGPCFEDDWSDFDLSGAYPTAMSLIGMPDWSANYPSKNVDDFTPETLGYAYVEFEFPGDTRYPTMPVRTPNGLIFPLKGVTDCAAPEIYLAKQLGAKITIKHGIIVPCDLNNRIFQDFIKECGEKRLSKGKKTLEGLFWKEISNSTYGKTAQGLRDRRVYDLRDRTTASLPPSRITNAYFAAFITSYVRAVLGEIMNSIPRDKTVFSCTTDGFLSNMSDAQAEVVTSGVLCDLYRRQRKLLAGVDEVLEKKHQIRNPLGWRTRGQATLKPGKRKASDDSYHIVLAKGGIWLKPEIEDTDDQNEEIKDIFFGRYPTKSIKIASKTGLRDMVEYGADFVDKLVDKRLNMEYDWKRRPFGYKYSEKYEHIAFSTEPWATVDQFTLMRDTFEVVQRTTPSCIKSLDDFLNLSSYVETKTAAASKQINYVRAIDGDIQKLRQYLCYAFKNKAAGFDIYSLTNEEFAEKLTSNGIKCSKANVENGFKKSFEPNRVPPTDRVMNLLWGLKKHIFKSMDLNAFPMQIEKDGLMIKLAANNQCPFIEKVK